MTNKKIFVYKFISLIDAFYENKNILSISTEVELNNIYVGKITPLKLKEQSLDLKKWVRILI